MMHNRLYKLIYFLKVEKVNKFSKSIGLNYDNIIARDGGGS